MRVIRDNTGIHQSIPVIITEHGPLLPLVRYILQRKSTYSPSYHNKLVQSVGLLLDFIEANKECFAKPTELFATFVDRLYTGTAALNGLDPSGLYWNARGPKLVHQLVQQLSDFSDWLEEQQGGAPLNPWRSATRSEEQLSWAAWHHRKNRLFLSHQMGRDVARLEASRIRSLNLQKSPVVEHEGVKRFPDGRIEDLLFNGFIVPGNQNSPRTEDRVNLRDILITMLLHFGGLRMSEPFHLYVHDVIPDPLRLGNALVRVYHPSQGTSPDDWLGEHGKPIRCNRTDYLRGKWNLLPRSMYVPTSGMYAGWKGNALSSNDHYMDVCWFPSWAGELFWKLWTLFLTQRSQLECNHPFAFVTADGRPHSIDAYKQAHKRAVERTGMIHAKAMGTSPHGHRHAYAQRLTDAGIDPIYRKRALHHKSIESQVRYTEPDRKTLLRAIDAAEELVNSDCESKANSMSKNLTYGFEDVDPLGLFSGAFRLLQRKH